MRRLTQNVTPLLERAIQSLTLAVELFNRPSEIARVHAVLMLLQHAFEMLLKAAILHRTKTIHEPQARYTYNFDRCLLFTLELQEVDKLLESGKRQGTRAAARLRSLMAFAVGARETQGRVSEHELATAVARRRKRESWDIILPEFARLRISTDGTGIPINMRISKDAPVAVRIAQPGEEVVGTVVKQEINIWDVYNMSRDDLAKKLELTGPKTHALIYELDIQKDPACYRVLTKKGMIFKGYSKKALDRLRDAKNSVNIAEVWDRHKSKFGAQRAKSRVTGSLPSTQQ